MRKNRLRELRKNNSLSCKSLEKVTGISGATINRYENCQIEGKITIWKKLADYFGVSFEYLVGWED